MDTMQSFLGKFGSMDLEETNLPSANVPNTLDAFMEKFTPLAPESYFFYNGTIELRFNITDHKYYKVGELGQLIEQHGVTNTLRVIDKSAALVPWGAKMMAEKLLRTVPLTPDSLMLAPLSLADFTKLVMDAKGAHKEKLELAGDIGHAAHKTLEDSIKWAIANNNGVVEELHNLPTDEQAKSAAQAGLNWMQTHSVRWIRTEQKIYSRTHSFAGTLDGIAEVSSCDNPACCSEKFDKSLSIIDFKTSNALRVEYIFQLGAYREAEHEEKGTPIERGFILRLGKDAPEFQPWPVSAKEFPQAFEGFLTCLHLTQLLNDVEERMRDTKKGIREVQRALKAEAKELAKVAKKIEKEAEKAQMKLDRAAEKERIKADAKKAREEAKLANSS